MFRSLFNSTLQAPRPSSSECSRREHKVSLSQDADAVTQPSDSGLTLMECVVAIAVIALTGALITPPLFLAAATRVQNRRAEQALQIAQGEIDRIRTLVEQGNHSIENLPATLEEGTPINNVPAPVAIENVIRTVNTTCDDPPRYTTDAIVPVDSLLPIDADGDCDPDFYLQSFRTTAGQVIGTQPSDFEVGVRVYSKSVTGAGQQLIEPLENDQASLRFTSGEGSQRRRPLAVLYTEVKWDGSGVSLYCFHGATQCS